MLSVNPLLPPVLLLAESMFGHQTGRAQHGSRSASQHFNETPYAQRLPSRLAGDLETDRNMAGASLNQLIDALGATIIHDASISGNRVLVALAEAAVLERELSTRVPQSMRVQQTLDMLLDMGPHVTAAVTAVLEHPLARAQVTCLFAD
jgi:hypothetical protein